MAEDEAKIETKSIPVNMAIYRNKNGTMDSAKSIELKKMLEEDPSGADQIARETNMAVAMSSRGFAGGGELTTEPKDRYMAAFREMKARSLAANAPSNPGKKSLGIGG
jgi:hypothetical protein